METNAYSDMLWFNCVKTETMTYRKHDLQKKKKKECSQMGIAQKMEGGRNSSLFCLIYNYNSLFLTSLAA